MKEEKKSKRITAQFCGGYILEDGTVVIEESTDTNLDQQENTETPANDEEPP